MALVNRQMLRYLEETTNKKRVAVWAIFYSIRDSCSYFYFEARISARLSNIRTFGIRTNAAAHSPSI